MRGAQALPRPGGDAMPGQHEGNQGEAGFQSEQCVAQGGQSVRVLGSMGLTNALCGFFTSKRKPCFFLVSLVFLY